MIQYLYIFQNDHLNKSTSVTIHSNRICLLKIYVLSNFHVYDTVLLIVTTTLGITSSGLIYFITGSLYLLIIYVKPLSHIRLFTTPWTAAHQAALPFTISQSLPKFMSTELVMPSNHLILSCPLLLLPSIFPINRVFSNESSVCISWPFNAYHQFCLSPK